MMIKRRRFIAAAGSGMIAMTAGCSGEHSLSGEQAPDIETTDGPAEFAVYGASWSGDTDVIVDSDTTLDIIIGNRGGEPAELEFEAAIESLESARAPLISAETSTIEKEVKSGETVTVTTETVNFGFAGRYEVMGVDGEGSRIPIADSAEDKAEIEVLPQRASGNTTQQLGEELRLAVDRVTFEQHVHYDGVIRILLSERERVGVQSALSDRTLAFVHATVENAGNSAKRLNDANNITFAGETQLRELGGNSLDSIRDIEGSPLLDASVNPGSTVSGWFLFNVPREGISEASLAYHRDSTAAPADVIWDVEIGKPDFPTFELVNMDVPSTRKEGYQEFEFTIRNSGDAAGTFRGEVEWREDGAGEWRGLLEGNANLAARIPAGSETTVKTGSDNNELSKAYEYRLNPFGATFVIEPSR
jgi:hypothetical protein